MVYTIYWAQRSYGGRLELVITYQIQKENQVFSGLSAFVLTPMNENSINEVDFVKLVDRVCLAGVDSIGVLGSTGNYAYLTLNERMHLTALAVRHAGKVPVIAGISALRTRDVLSLAKEAQEAGVSAVLLAPMSYQKLSDTDVFKLYQTVTRELSIGLCVYDNPSTTHFAFSDELHGRIAQLPNVRSIKIPGVPDDLEEAKVRVKRLRAMIPPHVTIGVSGDASGATGLNAGCEVWYSVIGGLFPHATLEIARAALSGNIKESTRLSERLRPIWDLFKQNGGSLRVIATAAELQALINSPSLPLPLRTLDGTARKRLTALIDELELS
jgi:4-hydroxy-tetrahydrodipicolinate synthase